MFTLGNDIEINPDKLFFTSDTHFGHFNIAKYCHRPFVCRKQMDETLIENWNKVVPEDAIVVHCGDFMLAHKNGYDEYSKYVNRLNGTIYLARGNHDRIPLGEYENGKLIVNDMIMVKVEGIDIMACHYPIMAYPSDFQAFGHIHTLNDGTCYGIDGDVTKKLRSTQYDVGVDQNDYTPISYWKLCDIFREKAKIQ